MHVLKTSFNSNPNVGLYGYCNEQYCLLGKEIRPDTARQVSEVLDLPVHQISMCGTSLLGVFLAGNSRKLLIPELAFDYELKTLDELGIDYEVIKTRLTALGNNLLCNDTGCLANPEFSADQKKRIRQALGVSLKPGTIAGLDTVGSLAVLNNRAGMIHRDIESDELQKVEELLGIHFHPSTINMGSPYLRSGVLCSNHGFVVGDTSGGPEIVNIDEELGYLEHANLKNKKKVI
ncbi:MAG: translation initiation factor IF-6 [Candidatus Woesearchaeota archaeon]